MIGTDTIDRVIGQRRLRRVRREDRLGVRGLPRRRDRPARVGDRRTGLFGTKESFVPIRDADLTDDGVRVPVSKDQVKDAPKIDTDGHLSPQRGAGALPVLRHRAAGMAGHGRRTGDARPTPVWPDTGMTDARGTVGHDTSGPTTDDAMTRSEERMNVGTRREEVGRARLRKYVVTENVTETVPVTREEVRVEREPITDANVGAAMDGPAISEEEHEVTLHAERPGRGQGGRAGRAGAPGQGDRDRPGAGVRGAAQGADRGRRRHRPRRGRG